MPGVSPLPPRGPGPGQPSPGCETVSDSCDVPGSTKAGTSRSSYVPGEADRLPAMVGLVLPDLPVQVIRRRTGGWRRFWGARNGLGGGRP
ncbi:MAG: hypothetical protein MZU97_07920 [Bacillus subtilis]|nr:hypothetical protein [Bacillus subtilis]